MKNILDSHIEFIEERYNRDVEYLHSNIGWVHTGTSITSKIYEKGEYVATYWQEGRFNHDVTKFD
jgi:hypothetical protein